VIIGFKLSGYFRSLAIRYDGWLWITRSPAARFCFSHSRCAIHEVLPLLRIFGQIRTQKLHNSARFCRVVVLACWN